MKTIDHISLIFFVLLFMGNISETHSQGFYKDVFMDGGVKLTSLERLPSADLLDLQIEHFASSRYTSTFPPTRRDSLLQKGIYMGTPEDLNGVLLYPDGQPRFRMIYVNGGKATGHGRSLNVKGRDRIRSFVNSGGSYVGSCAGAYFSSSAIIRADTVKPKEPYLHLWPGAAHPTKLSHSHTGMFVEKDSPLLQYTTFGDDQYIDSIRHNGGCYAYTRELFPPETEVLLRYDFPEDINGHNIHKKISAWAYKPDRKTGRTVVIGSHPEKITTGEQLDLMGAMLQYALDGQGTPIVKGVLKKGEKREMYQSTLNNDPAYTMIGDKQYHHFKVEIPEGAKNIRVELKGANGYDLFLYLNNGDFAFKKEARYKDISEGADKALIFPSLESGTWYLAVECNNTVTTQKTRWGVKYTGKTEVLNGVPYSLTINWE